MGKKNILLELKVERNWKEALTKTAVYIASIVECKVSKLDWIKSLEHQTGDLNEKSDWRFWHSFQCIWNMCPHCVNRFRLILLQQKLLQCCLQVNHLRVIAVLQFITHWPLCLPVQLTFGKGQCFAAKCHHWIFLLSLPCWAWAVLPSDNSSVVWQNVPLNKLTVTQSSQGVIKMLRRCWNTFGWLEASKWEVTNRGVKSWESTSLWIL